MCSTNHLYTNKNKVPENVTAEKQKSIIIKRTFNLPLTVIWKAWTDAESFKKWWGPKEYTCSNCTIDIKIGDGHRWSMLYMDMSKMPKV